MPSGDAMTQLIVTADDFNLSVGVSRGILEAHQHGIVTETSVMVNLGALQDAAAMLAAAPRLGIGLHLNITRGCPVAPPGAVGGLLGRNGQFLGAPQALPAQLRRTAVQAEFQAQVDTFIRAFGYLPQHLDTHHHVHQLPIVLEVLLDLAAALQLPVRSLDAPMRAAITAQGLASPAHFLGDAGNEPFWTVTRLLATIQELQPGVTELMCHPGYFDDAIAYSRYGRQRDVERQTLCSPEVAAKLQQQGIQLVTYAALRKTPEHV
jgi:chitin disaccharide deacetylase